MMELMVENYMNFYFICNHTKVILIKENEENEKWKIVLERGKTCLPKKYNKAEY